MTTTPPEGPEGPETPHTPPAQPAGQGGYAGGAPQGGYQGTPQGGYTGGAPGGPPPPGGYTGGATAYGAGPGAPQAPLSDSDQRLWATLAHVGGIFFSFVPPLVIWLVFKERGRFVAEQSKEALNWQITLVIGYIAAFILSFIWIGLLIYPLIWIAALVFGILAAVATNRGDAYRYPVALRLIS